MALNYKKDKQTFGLKLSPYIIFLKQHLFPTASQIICQQKNRLLQQSPATKMIAGLCLLKKYY